MRISKLLSLGLLSSALGAAGGCGGDYGLFDIHGAFPIASPGDHSREDITQCKLSISDGKRDGDGDLLQNVLSGFPLELRKITDTTLPLGYFYVGCGPSVTPQDIGHISYSTSRSSGSLIFTIDGLDASNTVRYSGSSEAKAVKVFKVSNDIQKVEVAIAKK